MTLRITPIIAHPERNFVFVDRPQLLYELVQMGALVQVNSRSFSGFYGSRVERALIGYLRGNLVHFLSSDGHNSGLRAPKLKEAFKIVEAIAGREYALAIVEANPRAVIENKLLPFLPDPISPEEKERSWKIRISSPFKWKP
jgi:protein-tyrosine phosphatase